MKSMPTAAQIDKACRDGLFVFYRNRQQILGAVDRRRFDTPIAGKIWIHRESDMAWEYVYASSVTITDEQFERKDRKHMPVGKGRPGAVSHIKDKKKDSAKLAKELVAKGQVREVAEESDGQKLLPGQLKKAHTAIEAQAFVVEKAKKAKGRANLKFNQETELLTKMMLEAGINEQDLPGPDNLIAEIDREPKAVVHKKKDPKKTRKSPGEVAEEADDEEEDGEE